MFDFFRKSIGKKVEDSPINCTDENEENDNDFNRTFELCIEREIYMRQKKLSAIRDFQKKYKDIQATIALASLDNSTIALVVEALDNSQDGDDN